MAHVPPEELLAHAAWLRRLAASLVRGDADADDLVQDAYLAALRRPPEGGRPVQGWLAEVIKNAWRMRARGEGRRARREAAALVAIGEGTAPSADALLARVEQQRRLVDLVTKLDEPLRTTVLLRYFEGLSAEEIARHQGVPAGTVRWRLKTGLDRLRAALDRESGGDRRAWSLLLLPLDRRGPSLATWLEGIWIMSRAAKAAAVVAALVMMLGAASLWRTRGAHSVIVGASSTEAPVPARLSPRRSSVAAPRPSSPVAALATVERDEDAPFGAFEGRVVNWSTGEGVAGAEVTFSIDGATAQVVTGEDGRFVFEPTREGRCVLALASAPGYLPFAPEWGHSPIELYARRGLRVRDLTVQLIPAIDYTARVETADGKPIGGASVTLLGSAQGEQSLHPIPSRFVTDERGEVIFHAPDDALLEARHPAHGVARARLDGPALGSHRVTLKMGAVKQPATALGAEKIAGRVVDEGGSPVAGALVHASVAEQGRDVLSPSAEALSDDAGHFSLDGLDAGSYTVLASHRGHATRVVSAVSSGTLDLVIDLRRGALLTGRVLDADGRTPVPAFTVIVARREGPVKEVAVAVRAIVDSEGRFTVADLDPGDYRVRATALARAPSRPLPVNIPEPPGSAAPVELTLTRGGRLTGKVIESVGGAPIGRARVSLDSAVESSSAVPVVLNALTGDEGDFELVGVPAGVRSITIGAYAHHIRIISGLVFQDDMTIGPRTFDLGKTAEGEDPRIELAGIGAALHVEGDGLRIDKLFPGGGALEVGLTPGDVILAIDGAPVTALGLDDSIQHIRGLEGSTVRLTVRRADGTTIDLATPRRRIRA